jgi:hypothetical protein
MDMYLCDYVSHLAPFTYKYKRKFLFFSEQPSTNWQAATRVAYVHWQAGWAWAHNMHANESTLSRGCQLGRPLHVPPCASQETTLDFFISTVPMRSRPGPLLISEIISGYVLYYYY